MPWLWIGTEVPHALPEWAGEYLYSTLKVSNAAYLSCVEQISYRKNVLLSLIRIFDPTSMPDSVKIEDFASFDEHPELILYEGYLEKATGRVNIVSIKH